MKRIHIALMGTAFIAIASAAAIFAVITLFPAMPTVEYDTRNSLLNGNAGAVKNAGDNFEEITDGNSDEKVPPGMFETHMNTEWAFPRWDSPSTNAIIGNATANVYPFYVTVTLKDTNELVYTSEVIPIGKVIKNVVLDRELTAGTYPAVVKIHMMSAEEGGEEIKSDIGVSISLVINS